MGIGDGVVPPCGWEDEAVIAAGVFGDAMFCDTVAPLLMPCYNLATTVPFLFSRADAAEQWRTQDEKPCEPENYWTGSKEGFH